MDCSQYVLLILKNSKIRAGLNPILYYSLKHIYNPEFTKRSRYFCRAIKTFFSTIGNSLDLDIMGSNSKPQMNNTYIFAMCIKQQDNLNVSVNKDSYDKLNNLFKNDWGWYITHLLDYDDTYILDQDEDYVLLYMIRTYIFGDEAPETSQLMLGYNLFVSSIELMFCLRLVQHYPKIAFHRKEEKFFKQYTSVISNRIMKFFGEWCKVFPNKYNKSPFIQELIKGVNKIPIITTKHIDVTPLTLDEPILTAKYVGLIKLIREGPFFYDIDEIARQMSLIEHENFCSITQKDIIEYIVKKEMPECFSKFYQREKQLQCYILIFLFLIKNLENKKNAIQNFIALAHQCKKMNNYQTEYTIISTFNKVSINKKTLLWRLLEKRYKDIFNTLEQEYLDLDLNEKTFFEQIPTDANLFVPHVNFIKNQINTFIIQIKMSNEEQKVKLSKEFHHFYLKTTHFKKSKYPFFPVNPLNDFLKFGFLEIYKTKQWNIKSKFDFSQYSNPSADFGKLLDMLVKFYKKNNS